jgi:hypothetical protein
LEIRLSLSVLAQGLAPMAITLNLQDYLMRLVVVVAETQRKLQLAADLAVAVQKEILEMATDLLAL